MDKSIFIPRLVNVNTLIHKGPCIVGNIVISGDGAAGDCDIYDGENANAERKYHLEVASGYSFAIGAATLKKFNYGIYIVVNAATTFVTVEYVPLPMDTTVNTQL